MTEKEKMQYAKNYIDQLANGINPLNGEAAQDNDIVNNIHISRCLFYVSSVLQNGRLIGAITHVLVDDPTTGYAIFVENMLETAQSVASENKLKDAS